MSKAKPNNSFIFLTTLGVYIGLLMVGSTPGIVAQQAATTRNFEISEEVEVKDDLDLNPKDEQAGFDERELERIISNGSVRSIVQVYLSQFAVKIAAANSTHFSDLHATVADLTANSSNIFSFWPNDVRDSSSTNITSLPRAALDTVLVDAK